MSQYDGSDYGQSPFDQMPDVAALRKEEERKAKEEGRESHLFWKQALSSDVGRREIWRLLQEAGTFRFGNALFAVSPDGSPHSRATDYHMGSRDFGRRWFEFLEMNHTDLIVAMRRENDPVFIEAYKRNSTRQEAREYEEDLNSPGPVKFDPGEFE